MAQLLTGKLRHRVTIQSMSGTVDTFGEVTPDTEANWSTVTTMWASVEPLSGRERMLAQQVTPDLTHKVCLRHRKGILPEYRFLVDKESTTLGAAITTTNGTSVTLSAVVAMSAKLTYAIKIDSEFMIVTAGHSTTTLTVTRGAYGTTAATHLNAARVNFQQPLYIDSIINVDEMDVELQAMCKERM